MKTHLYQKIARFWSVIFFLVGLLFLLFPNEVAQGLTQLAHFFSLQSTILMPRNHVGYVLALSLMVILTCLADASAREPLNPLPYRILLFGKLVSTVAFIYLAWSSGSAWMICALADGFVALTLWLSRQFSKPKPGGSL